MTARDMQECIFTLMDGGESIRDIVTFEDAGVLTRNVGLVFYMEDGSEFQVTIVRSK